MAKFLPFIVETSSPLNIYKVIMSRSKGIDEVLVLSIFNLIIHRGIVAVRETADNQPEQSLKNLYENILLSFSFKNISNSDLSQVHSIVSVLETYMAQSSNVSCIHKDLRSKYTVKDSLNFLYIMYINNESFEKYTELKLDHILDACFDTAEKDLIVRNLFSNEGLNYEFSALEELKQYVHFYGCVLQDPDLPPVRAVYKGVKDATS